MRLPRLSLSFPVSAALVLSVASVFLPLFAEARDSHTDCEVGIACSSNVATDSSHKNMPSYIASLKDGAVPEKREELLDYLKKHGAVEIKFLEIISGYSYKLPSEVHSANLQKDIVDFADISTDDVVSISKST